jgi:post-segregation antitoxin (ccd killing protein)
MIHKTISVTEEQAQWIKDNHLNLSRFVQDKLNEEIEERKT